MRDTLKQASQSADLEQLFAEWVDSYPTALRADFHKDGVVDEGSYLQEATRVLYILLEPNSKGGMFDRYRGWDLRKVFGEVGLGKSLDRNLARWTRALLDGETEYFDPDAVAAKRQLRRVAIINLKKLAGSGTANLEAISIQAWRDREYIRRQVQIINPSLAVTCGVSANRLFGWIITGDPFKEAPTESVWSHARLNVLPANHPSLRPKDAPGAFSRLVERASRSSVGAFGEKVEKRARES